MSRPYDRERLDACSAANRLNLEQHLVKTFEISNTHTLQRAVHGPGALPSGVEEDRLFRGSAPAIID